MIRTATVSVFLALLAVAANVVVLAVLALTVAARRAPAGRRARRWRADSLAGGGLGLAWLVATVATLGSLYYSEVAGFAPCRLCWYQRIAMYPLVVVLGVAAISGDRTVRRYVLPLTGIGGAISIYHYLLQWFPGLEAGSCDPQAPCAAFYVREFGFVSIPFMALSAFALITVSLLAVPRAELPAPVARAPELQGTNS